MPRSHNVGLAVRIALGVGITVFLCGVVIQLVPSSTVVRLLHGVGAKWWLFIVIAFLAVCGGLYLFILLRLPRPRRLVLGVLAIVLTAGGAGSCLPVGLVVVGEAHYDLLVQTTTISEPDREDAGSSPIVAGVDQGATITGKGDLRADLRIARDTQRYTLAVAFLAAVPLAALYLLVAMYEDRVGHALE